MGWFIASLIVLVILAANWKTALGKKILTTLGILIFIAHFGGSIAIAANADLGNGSAAWNRVALFALLFLGPYIFITVVLILTFVGNAVIKGLLGEVGEGLGINKSGGEQLQLHRQQAVEPL